MGVQDLGWCSHQRDHGCPSQQGEQEGTAGLGCKGQGEGTKSQAGGLFGCPRPMSLPIPPGSLPLGLSTVLSLRHLAPSIP